MCAEQTPRLTVAEARETAPPPSSEDGKDACVCVCVLSFQKAIIYLIQDTAEKKVLWLFISLSSTHGLIRKSFALNDKGLLETQCQHASSHTPGESETHTLQDDLSSYVSPTLFQVLNQRGRGLVGGGEKGKLGLLEEEWERGPIREELLSGGGGQPKGRILVLESGRGEEG